MGENDGLDVQIITQVQQVPNTDLGRLNTFTNFTFHLN